MKKVNRLALIMLAGLSVPMALWGESEHSWDPSYYSRRQRTRPEDEMTPTTQRLTALLGMYSDASRALGGLKDEKNRTERANTITKAMGLELYGNILLRGLGDTSKMDQPTQRLVDLVRRRQTAFVAALDPLRKEFKDNVERRVRAQARSKDEPSMSARTPQFDDRRNALAGDLMRNRRLTEEYPNEDLRRRVIEDFLNEVPEIGELPEGSQFAEERIQRAETDYELRVQNLQRSRSLGAIRPPSAK